MTVEHVDGERYAIGVRGHMIVVDQPLAVAGSDTAATPTELLVASLASCVAFCGALPGPPWGEPPRAT